MSVTAQAVTLKAQSLVSQADSKKMLKPKQWEDALAMTVKHYSKDKPRYVKFDVTVTGAFEYKLNGVVTGWDNGFSYIPDSEGVEFPADQQVPTYLENSRYTIYEKANGDKYLRFFDLSPNAPDVLRIRYAALHLLGDASTAQTIQDSDEHKVVFLACHYACLMLHGEYLQQKQSTIDADVVDETERGSKYQSLAEYYLKKYADLIDDSTEGGSVFAFGQKDLDIQPGYAAQDFLVHDKDRR